MAATIQLHVWTGAAAGVDGGSATSFSFLAIDSALDTAGARLSNPISLPAAGACAYSYEKWISACVSVVPANKVEAFKVWGTAPVQTYPAATCWIYGTVASGAGATPVVTVSTVATTNLGLATSDAKATWDAASYAAAGCSTRYLVSQLHIGAAACIGNWGGVSGCSLSYSYDET